MHTQKLMGTTLLLQFMRVTYFCNALLRELWNHSYKKEAHNSYFKGPFYTKWRPILVLKACFTLVAKAKG